MAEKKKKHHSKHRKHHSKHRKHKKHKKRRRRRHSTAPSGMPSVPTLEQNQYWLLHGRIAALENQAMQGGTQRSGGEKQLSRAEEVDIANHVIDENLKKARDRDNARPPENTLDDEDINFLKETRKQLEEEDKFKAFEEQYGFQQGGDDDSDDEIPFEVSELADPEMGSMLVDRDRARKPPRSPPEPKPEPAPQFKATSDAPLFADLGPEVVDPLNQYQGSPVNLGPSLADELADELAATTSPVFAQQENRPDTIGALQRRVMRRQEQIRTISSTGSRSRSKP